MPIHIQAKPDDIAPVVILPGDPDRARFIADTYLDHPRCYNEYRQLLGYTGSYRGRPVSVQTTGMGGPSAAIVVEEICRLGAQVLIRVGSCGAIDPELRLGDLVIPSGASSIDGTVRALTGFDGFAPTADHDLVQHLRRQASAQGVRHGQGDLASMDLFYDKREGLLPRLTEFGVAALEMEAAVVLTLARREGRRGACITYVSDLLSDATRIDERGAEEATGRMMDVVLAALADI